MTMMRLRRFLLAVLAVVLLAAIPIAVVAVRGLSADQPPGALETAVARRLVWLSVPAAARRAANPLAGQPDSADRGAEHFDDHCATCHGRDGRGQTDIGRAMYPPVPDLSAPAIQDLSDGALFSIIQHGVRWTGMPAFARSHSPEETWQLVTFIRRLPQSPRDRQGDSDDHHHDDHASRHAAATNTVAIDGTSFHPPELTVPVGTVVTWRNDDPFPHNVTSSAGGWHSPDLESQQSFEWKATTPGTFRYACTLHPGMKGVVHVQ
jgi:plastocyanin/mono/diheme cytochrome c family protein